MKYEAVFGDKYLADKFTNERSVFIVDRSGVYFEFEDGGDGVNYIASFCAIGDRYYMRRIIAEPKRWTVEDKKVGRLPEVGAEYLGKNNIPLTCAFVDEHSDVWGISEDKTMYVWGESEIKPIESPEEKSARLREEWCAKALSSCSILSGMQKYELKRLGGYIEDIYDALLSGDLPVPVKVE